MDLEEFLCVFSEQFPDFQLPELFAVLEVLGYDASAAISFFESDKRSNVCQVMIRSSDAKIACDSLFLCEGFFSILGKSSSHEHLVEQLTRNMKKQGYRNSENPCKIWRS